MNKYILDEDKNPVPCDDIIKWGEWFEVAQNRVVSQTHVGHWPFRRHWVSTVFLGLDHNMSSLFGPEQEQIPVLYETCIFEYPSAYQSIKGKLVSKLAGSFDRWNESEVVERYATKEEAQEGHEKWILAVRSGHAIESFFKKPTLPEAIGSWFDRKFGCKLKGHKWGDWHAMSERAAMDDGIPVDAHWMKGRWRRCGRCEKTEYKPPS